MGVYLIGQGPILPFLLRVSHSVRFHFSLVQSSLLGGLAFACLLRLFLICIEEQHWVFGSTDIDHFVIKVLIWPQVTDGVGHIGLDMLEELTFGLNGLLVHLVENLLLSLLFLLDTKYSVVSGAAYVGFLERVLRHSVELETTELADQRGIIDKSLTLIAFLSWSRLKSFLGPQGISIV